MIEIMTLNGRVFGVRYRNKRGFERKEGCPRVIVATGGVSYPATGSTGDGYVFAADTGHAVEPVRPSLTPLVSSCLWIKNMNGLLLRNVRATLCIDGEAVREEFGELGFSERGIEGAVALRMSRDAVDALIDGKGVGLMVDLKPGLTEEMLRERIAREMAELGPEEFFSELLRKLVPKALVIPLSEEVGAHSKNYIRKINDILGGALDNDSTTVDGAEPTPVYGKSQEEEEVYYSAPVTQQYMAAAQIPVVQAGYQTAAQADEAAYNSVISVISGQDYSGITQI